MLISHAAMVGLWRHRHPSSRPSMCPTSTRLWWHMKVLRDFWGESRIFIANCAKSDGRVEINVVILQISTEPGATPSRVSLTTGDRYFRFWPGAPLFSLCDQVLVWPALHLFHLHAFHECRSSRSVGTCCSSCSSVWTWNLILSNDKNVLIQWIMSQIDNSESASNNNVL